MREKTKTDITRPPLTDILVKYFFELRRTCPNYWWKKVPVFFIEYSAGQGFFAEHMVYFSKPDECSRPLQERNCCKAGNARPEDHEPHGADIHQRCHHKESVVCH